MCHVHLPVTPDSSVVDRFEPVFDATVEVRTVNHGEEDENNVDLRSAATEQRWHLHDVDVDSDWLPL